MITRSAQVGMHDLCWGRMTYAGYGPELDLLWISM